MTISIVERLRFDATRCELQFSKGVAGNISEGADEIERLREALRFARKRIEFYGTISDRRHFDHDLAEVYPKIDAALNSNSSPEAAQRVSAGNAAGGEMSETWENTRASMRKLRTALQEADEDTRWDFGFWATGLAIMALTIIEQFGWLGAAFCFGLALWSVANRNLR